MNGAILLRGLDFCHSPNDRFEAEQFVCKYLRDMYKKVKNIRKCFLALLSIITKRHCQESDLPPVVEQLHDSAVSEKR